VSTGLRRPNPSNPNYNPGRAPRAADFGGRFASRADGSLASVGPKDPRVGDRGRLLSPGMPRWSSRNPPRPGRGEAGVQASRGARGSSGWPREGGSRRGSASDWPCIADTPGRPRRKRGASSPARSSTGTAAGRDAAGAAQRRRPRAPRPLPHRSPRSRRCPHPG
jgi:hypothetical protein